MEIKSYAFHRAHGGLLQLTSRPGDIEIDGHVETRFGIVRCFSTDYTNPLSGKRYRWTTLGMIIDGRSYWAKVGKFYTKRGLVTLAQRFANQVAEMHA